MKSTAQLDAAILEAQQVRARHDGVHQLHSYVAVMATCRELMSAGLWGPRASQMFDEALANVRHVDRTGFAPKSTELPSKRSSAPEATFAEA